MIERIWGYYYGQEDLEDAQKVTTRDTDQKQVGGLYEKYEERGRHSRCHEGDKDGRDGGLKDVENWP
jgi:hypothetical protein